MRQSVEPAPGAPVPIAWPGARRGRPTPERTAAIDAAIRDAALAVFVKVGFDAATMEAVAQGARVSKGTLYARYESKDVLFRAVIEDELARWSQRAGSQDHLLPTDLGPRLRHHARILAEIYEWPDYQRLIQLIETALATTPQLAQTWEEIGSDRYLRFLAEDMAQAAPDVAADWEFLARLFFLSLSGWRRSEAIRRHLSGDEIIAFADKVIDTIELAVRAAPRR